MRGSSALAEAFKSVIRCFTKALAAALAAPAASAADGAVADTDTVVWSADRAAPILTAPLGRWAPLAAAATTAGEVTSAAGSRLPWKRALPVLDVGVAEADEPSDGGVTVTVAATV